MNHSDQNQPFDAREWIGEVHSDFAFFYRKQRSLFQQQSAYQRVEIVETKSLGKALLNDGYFMVSEKDEAHYHEMMVHVPLQLHARAESVLIIGGGDGGTAREVLGYPGIKSVVMVEIDAVVIEASRLHLPQTSRCLSDPRLKLIIGDGVEFLKTVASAQFDVILIDSTDPIGPAAPLFGPEFYQDVNRCLKADGIIVAQGESPYHNSLMQQKLLSIVAERFELRSFYNFTNLTYPGGLWSFLYASHSRPPLDFNQDGEDSRSHQMGEMVYYSKEVHRAAFALPEFQRRALSEWIRLG